MRARHSGTRPAQTRLPRPARAPPRIRGLVAGRVDPASRVRLSRLLLVDLVTRRSEFDRLKDAAKAASLNKFKARLDYLRELDELGPTEAWLEGLLPGKVAHFAGRRR